MRERRIGVGRQTFREAAHLAAGVPAGVGLIGALALAAGSAPLVAVAPRAALGGVQTLLGALRLEPARFWMVLSEHLLLAVPRTGEPDPRERWRAIASGRGFRRLVGYSLLRLPLSLVQASVLVVVLVWPLLLLATLVRGLVTGSLPAEGPFARTAWGWPFLAFLLAVALAAVVGVVAPAVVTLLVRLDLAVARALLVGPELDAEERIGELVEARSRVVSAADAERARIERDLHDGAQQRLIALGVSLGRAEARLRLEDPEGDALRLVRSAKAETLGVVADIRALTRGLRPPILDSRGLDAALSAAAAGLAVPTSIEVRVGRLEPAVESVLYFAVTECLTNVAKHAVGARASVRVDRREGGVRAEVRDDGRGGATVVPGGGLAGISDRLAGVDGRMWLSSPAGGPTIVRLEVPCAS